MGGNGYFLPNTVSHTALISHQLVSLEKSPKTDAFPDRLPEWCAGKGNFTIFIKGQPGCFTGPEWKSPTYMYSQSWADRHEYKTVLGPRNNENISCDPMKYGSLISKHLPGG
jgi:hypothetical protein